MKNYTSNQKFDSNWQKISINNKKTFGFNFELEQKFANSGCVLARKLKIGELPYVDNEKLYFQPKI